MLLIRHAIGSRLFYQTDTFEIHEKDGKWEISIPNVTTEEVENVLKFKEELNMFEVESNEKSWYYSSDARIELNDEGNKLLISADHKTVYPV